MRRPRRGPALRPAELAEAVVLADLSLALTIVGHIVPLGSVLLITAVVPLAVVAARHRLRAVIVGALAASVVGFLVIGLASLTTMAGCAAFGALVGAADRRDWSRLRTMVIGVAVLWPPIAALSVLALWIFSGLRNLVLDQIRNSWHGMFHFLENAGFTDVAQSGNRTINWIITYWWISIPFFLFELAVL